MGLGLKLEGLWQRAFGFFQGLWVPQGSLTEEIKVLGFQGFGVLGFGVFGLAV